MQIGNNHFSTYKHELGYLVYFIYSGITIYDFVDLHVFTRSDHGSHAKQGHWTLYVVNTVKRCIHFLDSNPYGPKLGGTTWKDYHFTQMDLGGRKLPWSKVIMSRLNKALQHVRPRSCFPKFGNFAIDIPPNWPTMEAGSNDCGFFVMRYIHYYDCIDGYVKSYIQSVHTNLSCRFIFCHKAAYGTNV
jgi:hypothetical protein